MTSVWKVNIAILLFVIGVYGGLYFYQHQPAENQLADQTDGPDSTQLPTAKQDVETANQFNEKSSHLHEEDPGVEGITSEEKERYRTINREIRETSKQRDEVMIELSAKPEDPYLNSALEEIDTKLYYLQSEASYLDEKFRQSQTNEEPRL